MPQLDGSVTVDEGHRVAYAGKTENTSTGRSRSFDPDDHVEESLGVHVSGEENWLLPGFGESHDECGDYRIEGVCSSCGEPTFAPHQCGRRECPNCWGIWGKQASMKRTERLQAVRYSESHKQAAHAVISLDRDIQTREQYLNGRSRAAEIAREKGWRHFDVIAHPWRLTAEAKAICEAEKPEGVGDWVWLRENYPTRIQWWHPDTLVKWGPHYHIIGVTGRDMEPAKDSDPYVYKFIDSLERFSVDSEDSYDDVYSVYRYLFSHVGVHSEHQFQAVVGYGGMSNAGYAEYEPESYVLDKIREMTEAVAASELGDDGPDRAGPDEDELGECDHCDDGRVISVFSIPEYIDQARPPDDISIRMRVAYEWRCGDLMAPPGYRFPSSEADAREAFWALVEDREKW